MKIGTKSVLFGAHCFFLHPWFVARAWWKLYGFPFDPRLWIAFFVHDLGYIGKRNMDGEEGETHPRFGARVMSLLFDWRDRSFRFSDGGPIGEWGLFVLLHSRFYAKSLRQRPSQLCIADKLSIALTPAWLYLPMVRATGEIREYMKLAKNGDGKYAAMNISTENQVAWYADVQDYLRRWVEEHKDGRDDTWTPSAKQAKTPTGVWQ